MNEVPKINNTPWDAPLFRKAPLIDLNTVIENLSKASYHYADDSGGEWGNADALARALIASEAARKLAEERLAVAQTIARQGKDTIATVLLLEIAAALRDHERVVLTRDETSLGPRIMEFAVILKEIDNG